jgi:hypothetical protein
MAGPYIQLEEASSVVSLKMLLGYASDRASAVYSVDPREYARSMAEMRGIIGQLADALEVNDQSRSLATFSDSIILADSRISNSRLTI